MADFDCGPGSGDLAGSDCLDYTCFPDLVVPTDDADCSQYSGSITGPAPCDISTIVLPAVRPSSPCCNQLIYDGTLSIYDCALGIWVCFARRPCDDDRPGSGSIIGGCIPGSCGICDDPPAYYTIDVSGFTGECDVFNDTWQLYYYIEECTWKASGVSNGYPVVITLTLDGATHTLDFEAYTSAGVLVSSTYTAAADTLPDCCTPITFESDSCECDAADTTGDAECTRCTTTPPIWSLHAAGLTGCYARLNGDWIFTQYERKNCRWLAFSSDATLQLYFGILTDNTAFLEMSDSLGEPPAALVYNSSSFAPDCCSDVTMNITYSACPIGGTAPASFTMHPHCEGDPPTPTCPAEIVATPTCCDGPPDDPTCDCPLCIYGAPPRWRLFIDNARGEFYSINGEIFLDKTGECEWGLVAGDITVTLSYDSVAAKWIIEFVNTVTGSFNKFHNRGDFLCCGDNDMRLRDFTRPVSVHGSVDDMVTMFPDGPCDPCDIPPGDGIEVSCSPGCLVPASLFVTFHDGIAGLPSARPDCTCMNSVPSFEIVYDPLYFQWRGEYTSCDVTNTFTLGCVISGWSVVDLVPPDFRCVDDKHHLISSSCSPYTLEFAPNAPNTGECCTGSFYITITE